jgi:hypothetical protein
MIPDLRYGLQSRAHSPAFVCAAIPGQNDCFSAQTQDTHADAHISAGLFTEYSMFDPAHKLYAYVGVVVN